MLDDAYGGRQAFLVHRLRRGLSGWCGSALWHENPAHALAAILPRGVAFRVARKLREGHGIRGAVHVHALIWVTALEREYSFDGLKTRRVHGLRGSPRHENQFQHAIHRRASRKRNQLGLFPAAAAGQSAYPDDVKFGSVPTAYHLDTGYLEHRRDEIGSLIGACG